MTVLCSNGDELHFLGIVDNSFGLDKRSITVRIIVIITVIVRSDLCCSCFGKVAHDLTELLHITACGERNIYKIDSNNALIKSTVILRVAILVNVGGKE